MGFGQWPGSSEPPPGTPPLLHSFDLSSHTPGDPPGGRWIYMYIYIYICIRFGIYNILSRQSRMHRPPNFICKWVANLQVVGRCKTANGWPRLQLDAALSCSSCFILLYPASETALTPLGELSAAIGSSFERLGDLLGPLGGLLESSWAPLGQSLGRLEGT